MFNWKTDFLALDFDGVIADSIDECLVVSHNAFIEYHGSGQKLIDVAALDKEKVDEFRRLRNFIRSGEDYVFIQLALHNRENINNQDDFDAFLEKHSYLKAKFLDLFYRERESFSSKQPNIWIELNPLYPGMQNFLTHYENMENLFIITTKKIEFVHKILKSHDIALMGENCLHAHGHYTKLDIIKDLLNKNKISSDDFYFIDDQVDTLIKTKQAGIHCHLAQWGYNNFEQWQKTEHAGIPVITLDYFFRQFFYRT